MTCYVYKVTLLNKPTMSAWWHTENGNVSAIVFLIV